MFWRRERYPYDVTLHVCGDHPYIKDRADYPTRDETVRVHARDWNDAEKEAFIASHTIPDKWSVSVRKIERVTVKAERT